MASFLAKRIAQSIVVFFIALTLIWFLLQLVPGDPYTQFILNPSIPPDTADRLRADFGLDKPLWQQYFIYLGNFFQGDLGVSLDLRGREVVDVILERLPRTVFLFVSASIVSFYIGFAVGRVIAWRRGQLVEYGATISGVYLFTVFTPWFALLFLWFFGFVLDWVPLGKFIDPELWFDAEVTANTIFYGLILTALIVSAITTAVYVVLRKMRVQYSVLITAGAAVVLLGASVGIWAGTGTLRFALDIVHHTVLPIVVLAFISFAGTMLLTRNSMLETLREDYVQVARAKGLPEKTIRNRYVSRNAILPVVTSLVLSLALAIDGGIITETIFSWEGLGLTVLRSSQTGDVPLATGALLFVGLLALVAHIVADALYVFLDPRLRF